MAKVPPPHARTHAHTQHAHTHTRTYARTHTRTCTHKVTGKGKPARQWEAAITLTIIEARKLRSADPFNGKPDGFVKVAFGSGDSC